VLCKIGKNHDISAGLIIGGKEVSFEQQRIQKTNIIVCTPGRLLQHMDETPNFDCSNLKMLGWSHLLIFTAHLIKGSAEHQKPCCN
jgi:ATP-dependent RNA helicase DDX10/DBP4